MDPADLSLIEQYRHTDRELAELWQEHEDLEHRLTKLERRPFLSPEEEHEVKELKKLKLAGRDRLEHALSKYRTH